VETLRPVDDDLEGEVQGCTRMCCIDILVVNERRKKLLWWRDEYMKSYNAKLFTCNIVLLYFILIPRTRQSEVWSQRGALPRPAKGPPRFRSGSLPSLRFLFKFTAVDESLSRRHTRCLLIWRLSYIQKSLYSSDHKHVWTGGYSRRPRGKFANGLVKFSRFCSPSNASS